MFEIGNTAARDNSEDKFFIHGEDRHGKDYGQHITNKDERESGPVVAAVEIYRVKKREHTIASHTIFSKMNAMKKKGTYVLHERCMQSWSAVIL